MTGWRDVVKVHPVAELFPTMSDDELRALGEDIKKNELQSPVTLLKPQDSDPLLLDGRNRLDAMEAVGMTVVTDGKLSVKFETIDEIEAFDPGAYVISANIKRRHLKADEKRELIATLLKAEPERSDRQIAETVKASPSTVGAVRAKLEQTGDVSKLDTHTDSKGRKQPAAKPKAQCDLRLSEVAKTRARKAGLSTPATRRRSRAQERDQAVAAVAQLLRSERLVDALADLVRLLADAGSRVAEIPQEKRVVIAQGYLQAIGVTADNLRAIDGGAL